MCTSLVQLIRWSQYLQYTNTVLRFQSFRNDEFINQARPARGNRETHSSRNYRCGQVWIDVVSSDRTVALLDRRLMRLVAYRKRTERQVSGWQALLICLPNEHWHR